MSNKLQDGLFAARREKFFDKMTDGVAVFIGSKVQYRNSDTNYPFRQNSDFYYLTGFEEPESYAFLIKETDKRTFILLVPPRNKALEVWTGIRAGIQGATGIYNADEAFELTDATIFATKLEEYMTNREKVYFPLGFDEKADVEFIKVLQRLKMLTRKGKNAPEMILCPRSILHNIRLIKTPKDIEMLESAIEITKHGFVKAMKEAKPGLAEFQIQALLDYEYRRLGSPRDAYEHIVAAGENACILHYVSNRARINEGDLILIDSGAEYKFYNADVTRTFPASKKFTEPQKEIYNLVLEAQVIAIKLSKPGSSLEEIHDKVCEFFRAELKSRGLFPFSGDKEIEEEKLEKRYYIHQTSHWLGMDTHDVGKYKLDPKTPVKLEPGMVFTVEPGLYFPSDDTRVPEKFRGIGIRIEDDILITEEGNINLTFSIPKTIADLESACE